MNYLQNRFSRLVEIAKALKITHQTGKSFHTSFALKGSKVVYIGTNSYKKSNPVCAAYKRTKYNVGKPYNSGIHSEAQICGKIKYRESWDDLTLVNIRINNEGHISDSCLCTNCAAMIYKSGKTFKRIFFSTAHGFLEFPQS